MARKNKKIISELGKKIKALREKQGLSQYALAELADIERSQIFRIEEGSTNATISTIASIADALKVKPKDLLDF